MLRSRKGPSSYHLFMAPSLDSKARPGRGPLTGQRSKSTAAPVPRVPFCTRPPHLIFPVGSGLSLWGRHLTSDPEDSG